MKAITLHQPWASLIALGVKTIETRSWATKHRGPIAIHAAKRESESWYGGGWTVFTDRRAVISHAGGWNVSIPAGLWAPGDDGADQPPNLMRWHALPLGAVVATANLVDCVPMVGAADGDVPEGGFIDLWDDLARPFALDLYRPIAADDPALGGDTFDISDQLPYGDFAPDRFGWLLEDIEPLAEPVPATGRQGLWNWEPAA